MNHSVFLLSSLWYCINHIYSLACHVWILGNPIDASIPHYSATDSYRLFVDVHTCLLSRCWRLSQHLRYFFICESSVSYSALRVTPCKSINRAVPCVRSFHFLLSLSFVPFRSILSNPQQMQSSGKRKFFPHLVNWACRVSTTTTTPIDTLHLASTSRLDANLFSLVRFGGRHWYDVNWKVCRHFFPSHH